tara:strand:+ start:1429 stop:2976 length:1548 start_codon:yes stop_codon:yes gene_type:complete
MKPVEYYNGTRTINVIDIKELLNPSQELANSMATGPQDELYTALDRFNGWLPEEYQLAVTPSWNWKPGTIPKFKEYLINNVYRINTKSQGLEHLMRRTREQSRYFTHYERRLSEIESKKSWLKREGYSADVDINEFTNKLNDMINKIESQCDMVRNMTNGDVTIDVVVGGISNPRNAVIYVDVYMENLTMNVFQGEKCIQKIPLEPIHIISHINIRKFINNYESKKTTSFTWKGSYLSEQIEYESGVTRDTHVTSFPFIATNYYDTYNNNTIPVYSNVCLDNYIDEVNKSFFSLNWVDMVMSLMAWAQYYNTSYSNPYNNLSELTVGMPKEYSKEYAAVVGFRNSCSRKQKTKYSTRSIAKSFTQLDGMKMMNDSCNKIGCQFAEQCTTYVNQSKVINNLLGNETIGLIESFIGLFIENDSTDLRASFVGEFGGLGNYTLNYDSDADVFWPQVAIFMKQYDILEIYNKARYIIDLWVPKNWWLKYEDGGELKDMDGEIPQQDMKEQMIRWATERG